MGKDLSGFDQWDAIVGRRSAEEGPVRTEMVLGRNSYTFDTDTAEMVKRASPWGAYIHDGWKLILQERFMKLQIVALPPSFLVFHRRVCLCTI